MTRYWTDEAYAQFYESSAGERGLINMTTNSGGAMDSADIIEPSRQQLETFQQAFAEWSGGHPGIRACDFRQFLLQLRVELSLAQCRSLWSDVEPKEGTTRLAYGDALLAYRHVLTAPLQFRGQPNAAPPGRRVETARVDHQVEQSHEPTGWQICGRPAAGSMVSIAEWSADAKHRCPARKGLGIPMPHARELLLAEGLLTASAEAFLRPFATDGFVPQTALFDYLAKEAGMQDDAAVGAPLSPAARKCAPQAPAPPRAPPVLA
jgi:hypothetical protein